MKLSLIYFYKGSINSSYKIQQLGNGEIIIFSDYGEVIFKGISEELPDFLFDLKNGKYA